MVMSMIVLFAKLKIETSGDGTKSHPFWDLKLKKQFSML